MNSGSYRVDGRPLLRIAREAKRCLRRFVTEVTESRRRVVSLHPDGEPLGNVLVGYQVRGFFEPPESELLRSHTQYWESMQIARTWCELGYRVDVFWNYDYRFIPPRDYDVFVGARMILEPVGERLDPDCLKVLHIDMAHWLYHRRAQYRRLGNLKQRRGVALLPRKTLESNRAIEYADCATMLGNEFTRSTYAFAGTPIYRVPISTVRTFPWPEDKDFSACRRRFVWFGGTALVHKGLDLVLEAFADMPDFHLVVCGPVDKEEDFCAAYEEELYRTPNIETVGWVDVQGRDFDRVRRDNLALVYPSCSEGGGGGVVTSMHAGLIPVVSYESSVDVDPQFGMVLGDSSVAEIKSAVSSLSRRPPAELEQMARAAWRYAREHHTGEQFAVEYKNAARAIAERHGVPIRGDEGELDTSARREEEGAGGEPSSASSAPMAPTTSGLK